MNLVLSVGEGVIAVALTWFSGTHSFLAVAIVLVFLIAIVFVIRFVIRALHRLFRGAARALAG